MSTGVVTAITTDWRGDTLAADVSSGATVLPVSSVVDFDEDGGWLVVGDSAPKAYLTVDEDANTVTLAGAVGAAYELGLPVDIWDPTVTGGGAKVVEYVATVELHDNTGSPDAVIPHDTIPTSGTELLIGATVRIAEDAGGDWYVAKVVGRTPVVNQTFVEAPMVSLTKAADQAVADSTTVTITSWTASPGTKEGFFGWGNEHMAPRSDFSGVDILSPGAYLVIATVDWANNTSGGRTSNLVLSRAGVDVETTQVAGAPAPGGRSTQQVQRLFVAEGNEAVKVTVSQSSGGSLNVRANLTSLQVLRVSAQ